MCMKYNNTTLLGKDSMSSTNTVNAWPMNENGLFDCVLQFQAIKTTLEVEQHAHAPTSKEESDLCGSHYY